MKNLLLAIFTLISVMPVLSQNCTPDPNLTTPGIFPPGSTTWDSVAVMPIATVGVLYDEVAQMLAPADTAIDTLGASLAVTVDSLFLIKFDGLPASFTTSCNTANCYMAGGDNACFKFTGTPTANDIGNHIVRVKSYAYAQLAGLGPVQDTFVFLMSIEVQATQSVEENVLARTVKVNPNPMNSVGHITFEVPDARDYTLEIIDLTGKKIHSTNGTSRPGVNSVRIDRNHLSEGLYFFALHWNGISHKGRLMFVD